MNKDQKELPPKSSEQKSRRNLRVKPTAQEIIDPHNGEKKTVYEHPGFGAVTVSRISGEATLFQSDFNHQYFIQIAIHEAYIDRHLASDWRHTRGAPLATVWLSEIQWAQMLTSMNVGAGAPCTIRNIGQDYRPMIDDPDTSEEQFKREHAEELAGLYSRVAELQREITNTKMTQKARKTLYDMAGRLGSVISGKIPFLADRFAEHIEETKETAKAEINAYQQNTALRAATKYKKIEGTKHE